MHGRALLLPLAALLGGCDAPTTPEAPRPDAPAPAAPAEAGRVTGRVVWDGPAPRVPAFRAPVSPMGLASAGERREWPHPHAPHIDPVNGGVGGAVVSLRGVDPARARPWDHPPACVVVEDWQARVEQGAARGLVGFVRQGDEVELVVRQAAFHSLRARGAAFFTLAFPDPDRPRRRRLDTPGVVEIDSNSGCWWLRAHLFVCPHPYYVRTAADGSFALDGAPPGDYELVCWLPDWREEGRDLDADTWLPTRVRYLPPLEWVRPVRVPPGGAVEATFRASAVVEGKRGE